MNTVKPVGMPLRILTGHGQGLEPNPSTPYIGRSPAPALLSQAEEIERLNSVVNEYMMLAKSQEDDLARKDGLLRRAALLCGWIMETPHQRGSINGQATQVGYAIEQELK